MSSHAGMRQLGVCNPYGYADWDTAHACLDWRKFLSEHVNCGVRYTVLRYPNVYVPRQGPHGEAGVVAIFTEQMLTGPQIVINGDGEQVRDFVYVGDCAEANYLALTGAPRPRDLQFGLRAGPYGE
jgi:nucleoside-diphosphate-sugar epimerase